jgi:hypothetical protein
MIHAGDKTERAVRVAFLLYHLPGFLLQTKGTT